MPEISREFGMSFAPRKVPPRFVPRERNMTQENPDNKPSLVELIQELGHGKVEPLKLAKHAAILWALAQAEGNVTLAADMLGTSRSTVYRCARTMSFQAA